MTTATETTVKTATEQFDGIRQPVRDLAERIKQSLELDTTSGLVAEKEPGTIYKGAVEDAGLSMETVDQVKKMESTVVAASTLAIGQIGVEAQKKHAELGTVQGTIQMYGDEKFTAGIHRESQARNPKTGESFTVHGQTFTQYHHTTAANKGDMGKTRSYLKSLANESLAKGK